MVRFPLHRYLQLVALAVAQPALAGLLAATFQDHAVLQRQVPVPLWGVAAPGVRVTVTLTKDSGTGTTSSTDIEHVVSHAGPDGGWQATLPALPPGGPYTLTAASSAGTQETASDILIGDVFLCSGQSNMEYPTRLASDYDQDVNNANNGLIRLFHIERYPSAAPRSSFGAGAHWDVTSPQSVREFSAVCYFFGRALQPAVGVPIGLIESAWGGSVIQAWLSAPQVRRLGGYDRYLDLLPVYARSPAQAWQDWDRIAADWWRAHDPASTASPPWYSPSYHDVAWARVVPGGTWREWNVPALQTFNGLVWLRKEFDLTARQAGGPAVLSLGAMDQSDITWVDGLQVGADEGYDVPRVYHVPSGVLRAGLAVTIDIGSPRFLHPTDKQDVGERLALLARSLIYGQSVVGMSPSPLAAWRTDGEVLVRFDTHGGGLETVESNRPIGFQLCDRAGRCTFADAMQRGTDIAVDASSDPQAVTVRYCWADSPICNLFDREGLPAVPFELPIGRAAPEAPAAR